MLKHVLIILLLLSLTANKIVYAAEGDEVEKDGATTPSENNTADKSIISEPGEINGYLQLWVGDQKLDATYLPEQLGKQYGSILILPDSGDDIDGRPVVHRLRFGLRKRGWSVMTLPLLYDQGEPSIYLSVNDPSVSDSTELVEADEQADSAAEDDGEQPPSAIVMEEDQVTAETDVGKQEQGTEQESGDDAKIVPPANQHRIAAALNYLKTQLSGPIVIIAIGEAVSELHKRMPEIPEGIGVVWINVKMPIIEVADVNLLDIVAYVPGENNQLAVDRQALMKRESKTSYVQRRIINSDPQLIGSEDILLATIKGWLQSNYELQGSNR